MKTLSKYKNGLPKDIVVKFKDLVDTHYLNLNDLWHSETEDMDLLSDSICDWLSDKFEFCHNGFSLDKIDYDKETIYVSNIEWDTTE